MGVTPRALQSRPTPGFPPWEKEPGTRRRNHEHVTWLRHSALSISTPMSPQQSNDCYCQIFEHLTKNYDHFESKVIVPLDDLVVCSLFGQKTLKKRSRVHSVQKVGQDFEENAELAARIYAAFEKRKFWLDPENPSHYVSTLKKLALELHQGNSAIKCVSPQASKVLDW